MQTHKYISNLLIQSVPHLCGWTRESSGFMHCGAMSLNEYSFYMEIFQVYSM